MKVTYIDHSGFMIELVHTILVFDYYRGEIPAFDQSKKVYVFASHTHQDHFNREILDWQGDIQWILSKDIRIKPTDKIHQVKANSSYIIDELKCETLHSTDQGVAFMVNVEGVSIYHAGDLNWWHWEGENSDGENKTAKNAFLKEMDKLKDRTFDLAFVPLDPRQEKQFSWGMLAFLKSADAKLVFPMHMWEDYAVIERFLALDEAEAYKDKIVKIEHMNQLFTIKEGENHELYI